MCIRDRLRLSLDSEDGFHTGCRNVSRTQQSSSGFQSPRRYFSIRVLLILALALAEVEAVVVVVVAVVSVERVVVLVFLLGVPQSFPSYCLGIGQTQKNV